jgi:hypothetical protein
MVDTTARRQPAGTLGRRQRSPLLLLLLLLGLVVLVLAGCGDDDETATDSSSTSTSTTEAEEPTTSSEEATTTAAPTTPGTDSQPPTPAQLTVDDLEQGLVVAITETFPQVGSGQLTCEGSGLLTDWQTVQCRFLPDEPMEFGPIYVSIFDKGRYAWAVGACCDGEPQPERYPSGMYCRDLILPPPDSVDDRDFYHLSYGVAVYYWLNEGRPDRMDADTDGQPCETVYPADEVERFWKSVRVLEPAS